MLNFINETDGTVEVIDPTIVITVKEYKELIAKAEKLLLIEKALDTTTLPIYQIKALFFSEEGER